MNPLITLVPGVLNGRDVIRVFAPVPPGQTAFVGYLAVLEDAPEKYEVFSRARLTSGNLDEYYYSRLLGTFTGQKVALDVLIHAAPETERLLRERTAECKS